MSKVSIVKTGNDIYAALDEALGDIGETATSPIPGWSKR
jgi:hypothetical protein